MPEFNFFQILPVLRELPFKIKILLLSGEINKIVFNRCIRLQIDGIIHKEDSVEEIIKGLNYINNGKKYIAERFLLTQPCMDDFQSLNSLTQSEMKVFRLLSSGYSLKHIASLLGIRLNTVDVHKRHIKRKLGVKNNTDLLKIAFENNINI